MAKSCDRFSKYSRQSLTRLEYLTVASLCETVRTGTQVPFQPVTEHVGEHVRRNTQRDSRDDDQNDDERRTHWRILEPTADRLRYHVGCGDAASMSAVPRAHAS